MSSRPKQTRAALRAAVTLAALAALAGCTLQWQNRQAAQELAAERAQPVGSLYGGWRVFQERCAGCHGPDAAGTTRGPDLLPRVGRMGQHQFVSVVLHRYDWPVPAAQARGEGPAHEALVTEVEQRRLGALTMPAWQGEPTVQAHIVDLYAWLSARAQGTLGPGRPAP